MNRNWNTSLLLALLASTGIALWTLNPSESPSSQKMTPINHRLLGSSTYSPSISGAPYNISSEELENIKQELTVLNTKWRGEIRPEFQSFVEQMVADLLFTPQMYEILKSVWNRRLSSTEKAIGLAFEKLLKDPSATHARKAWAQVASDPQWKSLRSLSRIPFADHWG